MATSDAFFRNIELTDLTLRVRDLERVSAFYRHVLNFEAVAETADRVALAPRESRTALLILESAPDAARPAVMAAGLFHVAILLPDRAALGRMTRWLEQSGLDLGAADHGVSEALYLNDPEGNGLEIYADRPVTEWPPAMPDGQVRMSTEALDLASLVAEGEQSPGRLLPAGTRIGHVHLSVSDLKRAESFYDETLGFAVRQRSYRGALFLGRDGYHHHIGANTWRSRAPAVPGALGLAEFTLRIAAADEFARVVAKLNASGRDVSVAPDEVQSSDFDNLAIRVVHAS